MDIAADGSTEMEISQRVVDGVKFQSALRTVRKERSLPLKVMMSMFDSIVVQPML